MSIHDFHSKLSSRIENNSALFEALRRLRRLDDVRTFLFEEEIAEFGWYPWTDETEPVYPH